jgi:hypothetical protein
MKSKGRQWAKRAKRPTNQDASKSSAVRGDRKSPAGSRNPQRAADTTGGNKLQTGSMEPLDVKNVLLNIKPKFVSTLQVESKSGLRLEVAHAGQTGYKEHVQWAQLDGVVFASEWGYAPLNSGDIPFLTEDLGLEEETIIRCADWNRYHNPRITLVAIRPKRSESKLKGIILAPGTNAECFMKRASPNGRRLFYQHVTYEALRYLAHELGCRRIGITDLRPCDRMSTNEMALAISQGVMQFWGKQSANTLDSIVFVACEINQHQLQDVFCQPRTPRRAINVAEEQQPDGITHIHLDW